ncbi:hypothetical protein ACFYUV_49790 [Nonomuraea sp. NPDC003560]|uniref:hypothetical protein n=1 Tax=Nonomuraea sp. NPDC003560 TaxID=3364341 RepID=UPI0036AC71F2
MTTESSDVVREGHQPALPANRRRREIRRRAIAAGLTALALLATTAAPATAATHLAARQSMRVNTCDRGTFYSFDQWSKGNAQLCVNTWQRGDGSYAVEASFYGDFYYYWGGAWYSDGDCVFGCSLSGNFTLEKSDGSRTYGWFSNSLNGNSGWAGHTFDVGGGRYQLTAAVRKEGGYWRNQGSGQYSASSIVPMHGLKITVDLP